MKNTFTICFRSKEFVGPPLTLPTPHRSPHIAQAVSSPGLLLQPPGWYPASTLTPADYAQPCSQAGTPASAQNLSVVPAVAQKAQQGLHNLPVTALTPSPPPPFLTPSVPATLASGGSPCLPGTLQESCTCHTPVLHALPTDTSTLHCIFPFRPLLKSHLPVKPSQVQPRRPQLPLDLETVQSPFLLCF